MSDAWTTKDGAAAPPAYNAASRYFHWVTAGFIAVMVPVGVVMSDRGERNIWDGTTNALYSSHKVAGFALLFILMARLAWRLMKGVPPDEPTLAPWQRTLSHLVHGGLYVVLFSMAITGWLGVSLFPALDIFGLFSLPALTAPNEAAAKRVLGLHSVLGYALMALIAMHVGAALFHHFILKDGVLRRILPKRG